MTIVQSLWIGSELTNLERTAICSHLKHGHEYHLYCYNDITNVPKGVVLKDGREILPENDIFAYKVGDGKGSYSAFSNYFRYKLILDKGNWWVDTDVVCLKSFDFEQEIVFGSEVAKSHKDYCNICSCIFKAPAGSGFLEYCLSICLSKDKETLKWGTIGPLLITESVLMNNLWKYVMDKDVFCPINWFDWESILERDFDFPQSYTVHLWNEMWRRNNKDKNSEYSKSCLYEKLKDVFLS